MMRRSWTPGLNVYGLLSETFTSMKAGQGGRGQPNHQRRRSQRRKHPEAGFRRFCNYFPAVSQREGLHENDPSGIRRSRPDKKLGTNCRYAEAEPGKVQHTRRLQSRHRRPGNRGQCCQYSSIADEIEKRRIALGKTSGFERQYARVTLLYFGGMAKHLASLRPALKRGAKLAYVVGDQASYLRVMIRTGELLADIADTLGYTVTGIDLFRTRLSTVTGEQLREEVVMLEWPGR